MNGMIKIKDKKQTGKRHLFANSTSKDLNVIFKNAYKLVKDEQLKNV